MSGVKSCIEAMVTHAKAPPSICEVAHRIATKDVGLTIQPHRVLRASATDFAEVHDPGSTIGPGGSPFQPEYGGHSAHSCRDYTPRIMRGKSRGMTSP